MGSRPDGEIGAMLSAHGEAIARDVLARAVTLGGGFGDTPPVRHRTRRRPGHRAAMTVGRSEGWRMGDSDRHAHRKGGREAVR